MDTKNELIKAISNNRDEQATVTINGITYKNLPTGQPDGTNSQQKSYASITADRIMNIKEKNNQVDCNHRFR